MSKRGKHQFTLEQAEQLIKCTAVILRDHTPMEPHDAALALLVCWQATESRGEAERRSKHEAQGRQT